MNKNLDRRIHPIAEANGLSPKFHCNIKITKEENARRLKDNPFFKD